MADTRNSAEFAFTHVSTRACEPLRLHILIKVDLAQFDNSYSGWPEAWSFFVGILQSAYTLTGYGMVAALCEEVRDPAREVPKAMGKSEIQERVRFMTAYIWLSLFSPLCRRGCHHGSCVFGE